MPVASRPVFRFAPSPTGALHLGHVRSAVLNSIWASRVSGRFLLRIEDIDTTRLRDDHVASIFADLAWLGLSWEQPVWRQSTRMAVYEAAWTRLDRSGLLYPCFASRTDIAAAADPTRLDPDGAPLYPGLWRDRPEADVAAARRANLPAALRLDMARALAVAEQGQRRLGGAWPLTYTTSDLEPVPTTQLPGSLKTLPPNNRRERSSGSEESKFALTGAKREVVLDAARWGDFIIARKETPTSYHLSVVVDDAAQGVTHVVRGQDLEAATAVHRLLQVLLGLPAPRYHHHALILGPDGRKLSKSAGSESIAMLRASGLPPAEIIRRAMAGL